VPSPTWPPGSPSAPPPCSATSARPSTYSPHWPRPWPTLCRSPRTRRSWSWTAPFCWST